MTEAATLYETACTPIAPQVALGEQLEAAGCRMLAVHGRHCPPPHAHRQARLARCAADLDAVRAPPALLRPLIHQAAASSPFTLIHFRMHRGASPRALTRPVARARPFDPEICLYAAFCLSAQVRAVVAALHIPVLSNGNTACHADVAANLAATGAAGVMSGEGNLPKNRP